MTIDWVFDPAAPSGARKGGNAAEYGFEGRIDTLVRETVQNSMDAGKPGSLQVDVRFRLVELTGDKMHSFLEAMAWDSLRDNLESIPRNGESIGRAIEEMYKNDRILLLCIEDRGTDGLSGAEKREDDGQSNRFSALVRDELYSDKEDDPSAGGSYGLGKILLWVYSAYKTVLFASVPKTCPAGKSGVRFIGRTSLPYHQTDEDGKCAGPGWLGVRRHDEAYGQLGYWAESVWGDEAKQHADECHASREAGEYGLSTVIVGFEEPGQETREIPDLVDSIRQSALESFWPALTRQHVCITVTHELDGELVSSQVVDPFAHDQFSVLSQILQDFDQGRLEKDSGLKNPGDATWVEVPIEVPQRIAGALGEPTGPHDAFSTTVKVLVSLIDDDESNEQIKDKIYRFRRPGMIVRQGGGGNLSISARPYAAAVLCGEAAGHSDECKRVEYFLRSSEPPEHDKWQPDTRAVKAGYVTHGVKAKLDRFENAIRKAIRDLVSVPEEEGGELPKELLKHLRFGDSTGGGNPRFLTATTTAHIENGAWRLKSKIRKTKPAKDKPWTAVLKLKYAVDGGAADDVKAISEVHCEDATQIKLHNGDALLEFPPSVKQAVVEAKTAVDSLPAIGPRAIVKVSVDGSSGGMNDV